MMKDKKQLIIALSAYFVLVWMILCVANFADNLARERKEYQDTIRYLEFENAILRITPTPTSTPTPTPTPTSTPTPTGVKVRSLKNVVAVWDRPGEKLITISEWIIVLPT